MEASHFQVTQLEFATISLIKIEFNDDLSISAWNFWNCFDFVAQDWIREHRSIFFSGMGIKILLDHAPGDYNQMFRFNLKSDFNLNFDYVWVNSSEVKSV